MKKLFLKNLILVVAVVAFASCENDSTDDLIINNVTPETNVTYTQNVATIIDNNCIFCHGATPSNGAPMSLTTYEQVKEAVQNRGLIDRISREQGAPGMMPNGGTRLPQSAIDIIVEWNQDGLQE